MFKIGNFSSENNPCERVVQVSAKVDTWTDAVTRVDIRLPVTRIPDRVTGLPKRICDRLFAPNDAEAYWWGWQIIKVRGGFRRRYRHPEFDTLVACTKCQGTGLEIVEIIGTDMPCARCYGVGRLTSAGADVPGWG